MSLTEKWIRPAPVIVLCAPRSFSSVFCMMLGQHPQLYGFPELNLFAADSVQNLFDLQAVEANVVDPHAMGYTSGVVRALAELEYGGQTAANIDASRRLLWERRGWSTARLLDFILDRVAPKAGVDKSPRTAMSSASVMRMRRTCPDARIIHLTREPWACVRSLVRSNLPFCSSTLADGTAPPHFVDFWAQLWIAVQKVILQFTATVGPGHVCRVRGEHVLLAPETALRAIAKWLGIDDQPAAIAAMLHPERSVYAWPGPPELFGDNDRGFQNSPVLRRLQPEPATEDICGIVLRPHLRDELRTFGARLGYE